MWSCWRIEVIQPNFLLQDYTFDEIEHSHQQTLTEENGISILPGEYRQMVLKIKKHDEEFESQSVSFIL